VISIRARREVAWRREVFGGSGWATLEVSASFSSILIWSGSDSQFGLVSKEEEKPGGFL
jgi:hypothetical protein